MRSQVVTGMEVAKIDNALLSEDAITWDFIEEDHLGYYENDLIIASLIHFVEDKWKFVAWTRE